MHNIVSMLIHYFTTKEDKVLAAIGGFFMYIHTLFVLELSFTWQYFLSSFLGIFWIFLGAMATVAGKKFYTWGEPKVIKFSKTITIKFRSYGKKNNKRSA